MHTQGSSTKLWREAKDPISGHTYHYNIVTGRTNWRDPSISPAIQLSDKESDDEDDDGPSYDPALDKAVSVYSFLRANFDFGGQVSADADDDEDLLPVLKRVRSTSVARSSLASDLLTFLRSPKNSSPKIQTPANPSPKLIPTSPLHIICNPTFAGKVKRKKFLRWRTRGLVLWPDAIHLFRDHQEARWSDHSQGTAIALSSIARVVFCGVFLMTIILRTGPTVELMIAGEGMSQAWFQQLREVMTADRVVAGDGGDYRHHISKRTSRDSRRSGSHKKHSSGGESRKSTTPSSKSKHSLQCLVMDCTEPPVALTKAEAITNMFQYCVQHKYKEQSGFFCSPHPPPVSMNPISDRGMPMLDFLSEWSMRDYLFSTEEHKLLDLFLENRWSVSDPKCLATVRLCSDEQLCKVMPIVVCAIAQTPLKTMKQAQDMVNVLVERAEVSWGIDQALHSIKSSGLLSEVGWIPQLRTRSQAASAIKDMFSHPGLCVGATFDMNAFTSSPVMHPFHPDQRIVSVTVRLVLASKAKPLLVSTCCTMHLGDLGQSYGGDEGEESSIDTDTLTKSRQVPTHPPVFNGGLMIIKTGDDLNQDVACLHIMGFMNGLWKKEKLAYPKQSRNNYVLSQVYGALALTNELGAIEFVPDCLSLRKLGEHAANFSKQAIRRLVSTAAGSYMAAYVLGIRDRHSDNILISMEDGALFHIDFGHILGHGPPVVDAASFAITPGLKTAMGTHWPAFVDLCIDAYLILRKHSRLITHFCTLLLNSFMSASDIADFIESKLRTEMDDEEVTSKLRSKLELATKMVKTRVKNALHGAGMVKAEIMGTILNNTGRASLSRRESYVRLSPRASVSFSPRSSVSVGKNRAVTSRNH